VKILQSFAIFVTYAVQFYVAAEILWEHFRTRYRPTHQLLWQLVLRATLVIITCKSIYAGNWYRDVWCVTKILVSDKNCGKLFEE